MKPQWKSIAIELARHLAVLSILFHAVLTAIHVPAAFAATTGPQLDADTGVLTVVICTPGGIKRVAIDDNGEPVEQHEPFDPQLNCPHCVAGCGGCFALTSAAETLLSTAGRHSRALKRVLALTQGRVARSDHTRDPPLSV